MTYPTQPLNGRGVHVPAGHADLAGDLVLPASPAGVVLFAHGSGSSRFSSRNRFVAQRLNEAGLATLLMDLLTPHEERVDERSGHLRFDIGMLAERLVAAVEWLRDDGSGRATAGLPVGIFGASTGGGAALVAAAQRPQHVAAVVSRAGRPDLAGDSLMLVRCPTLLIVGGDDDVVIGLNEQARDWMSAPVELQVIPGAGHLFEEPGKLERVADLAREWFARYLSQ